MGKFYIDESIREHAGFIIGALVYLASDITQDIECCIEEVGLRPSCDEFKSRTRMRANPRNNVFDHV